MSLLHDAIDSMATDKTPIDRVILHKCLMLDNSKLTMEDVDSFMGGRDVLLNIIDATKLFVYINCIQTHIMGTSGYNICMELLRSMVLGTTGKMGFDNRILSKMDEDNIMQGFRIANLCESPIERAARVYATIVHYDVAESHAEAIGYLMMLYSLKKDGYEPYIPSGSYYEDMHNIREVELFSVKVDKMINALSVFYSEV